MNTKLGIWESGNYVLGVAYDMSKLNNKPLYTIRNPETGAAMTTTTEAVANAYCDSLEQQGIAYVATVEINK